MRQTRDGDDRKTRANRAEHKERKQQRQSNLFCVGIIESERNRKRQKTDRRGKTTREGHRLVENVM